jgi:hypothetical protein
MTGRHLMHAVEQRAIGHQGTGRGLMEALVVPAPRHSGNKQRLDFGGQIKRAVVDGVVERFDPETIARGEEGSV